MDARYEEEVFVEVGSAGDGGRSGNCPEWGFGCDPEASRADGDDGIGTGSGRLSSGGAIYRGTGSAC